MAIPLDARQPFYFARDDQRLFGCFHPPATDARGAGALLVAPPGREGIRAHRSLHQLGVELARDGFPVLRFDLSSCGDSSGETADASWEAWRRDLASASDQLRHRGRVDELIVVGLRLGATLGLEMAEEVAASGLVGWDPVLEGRSFVESLTSDHQAMLAQAYVDARREIEEPEAIERLGFLWRRELLDEIASIDGLQPGAGVQTFLVESEGDPGVAARIVTWPEGSTVHRVVPAPRVWSEEPYKGLVPRDLLDAIARWCREAWR